MLEVNYKKISKYIEKAKYWQFFICSWGLSYCMFNFGYNIRYEPLGIYAYQPFTVFILSFAYIFSKVAYYLVKIHADSKTYLDIAKMAIIVVSKAFICIVLFREIWIFLLSKGIDLTFLWGSTLGQ